MCGIFAYSGPKSNAPETVFEGLKSLEYRGYDSWGVVTQPGESSLQPKSLVVKKRIGKIGTNNINELPSSHIAIGHTRWATHGKVTELNAHPHLSCDGKIAIVHNGIIENFVKLQADLRASGHKFVSETDSEVIAHLLEEERKTSDLPTALRNVFSKLKGLNAVIAMELNSDTLVATTNGSPLVIGIAKGEIYMASDPSALLPYTTEVIFLEDGVIAIWSENMLRFASTKTGKKLEPTSQQITWKAQSAEKGAFAHFMLKEMHEQAAIIRSIAKKAESNSNFDYKKLADRIKKARHCYLVGCGSSWFIARIAQYVFAKIGVLITPIVGSEFLEAAPALSKDDFLIVLSQSGETMDSIKPVKLAKKSGTGIGALVNVPGSSISRLADITLLIEAGPEKAVATTKAFTATLMHLLLVVKAMDEKLFSKLDFNKVAYGVERALSTAKTTQLDRLAKKFQNDEHLFCLGRGVSFPVAQEAALKVKEVSYLHAEGLAGGELKHGPLALITEGTPCVVLAPNDETYADAISGAMEMKARGGFIIGISPQTHQVFDEFIAVDDLGLGTIFLELAVVQYFGYALAIAKGLDPDMPRNLAKSVTVG
ncbi:MAG: glutamine--fructose-6-phosphate transaminase (isomerizing) [Candidatus Pacebacteria bacterium CG_4_10_14_0_8_um_filter_42_14]|nr:MAG: glutamine--fructose-6-phosphate transaminase (isomerizing) [Candidatus Pacebacteria bacterium CG_4_10_14_0_8_um_filter_42_14]